MPLPLSINTYYQFQCEIFFGIYECRVYGLKRVRYDSAWRFYLRFSVLCEEYSNQIGHIAESILDVFGDEPIKKTIRKTFLRFSIRFTGLWEKIKSDFTCFGHQAGKGCLSG